MNSTRITPSSPVQQVRDVDFLTPLVPVYREKQTLSSRAEELGENEALFRDVNETVAEIAERRGPDEPVEILCECSDTACAASINLSCEQYEQIRAVSNHFVVRPGHARSDIERVVERRRDHWIVEKFGEAGAIAEETDPRG